MVRAVGVPCCVCGQAVAVAAAKATVDTQNPKARLPTLVQPIDVKLMLCEEPRADGDVMGQMMRFSDGAEAVCSFDG